MAKLFDLSNHEAVQKLAADFGLDPETAHCRSYGQAKASLILRQFREDECFVFPGADGLSASVGGLKSALCTKDTGRAL